MNNKPEPKEEFVHEDDRIIGRAFRYSALILGGIVLIVAVIVVILKRPPEKGPEQKTIIAAPESREPLTSDVPNVRFVDVREASGIDFVHNNGATGEKLLPESLGGGVLLFDFDQDGDSDILFVNSTWWPWDLEANPELKPTTSALYRNDTEEGGKIKFANVTKGSGLDVSLYGMGGSCADFDGDGDADVFLTCVGENKLFRNDGGGKFTDISEQSGVTGHPSEWSTASAFFDYDNDGHLDLFVANYVNWSREIDFQVNFTIDGTHRAYGPPTDFEGAFPQLFRNNGDGTFTDVSEASGVKIKTRTQGLPMAKSLGVAPQDINGDGHMDLLIANDTVPNFLFINEGDGTFTEQGAVVGVAYDSNGKARGAMGIDTAYHRNDQDLGIAIGNFANEMTALFVSQGQPMLFADEAIAEGVGPASRLPLKFGIFFFDFDLNGWLDLLSVNGHLDEDITRVQSSQHYRQPAQLFWNNRGRGFQVATTNDIQGDLFSPIVGRGSAYADFDRDGDQDVVLSQLHGAPLILRNDQQLGHNWLRFKLIGSRSNRDAIGSRITIEAAGSTRTQRIMPTKSYLSQSELESTFGLGEIGLVESILIRWPDGSSQELDPNDFPLNQLHIVRQP